MRKVLYTLALVFVVSFLGVSSISAQTEKDPVIEKIAKATSTFGSIVCDITQTREVAMMDGPVQSKGKMNYLAPNMLRLDYTTPEKVSYVINGSNITTISEGKKQEMDLSSNKKVSGMFDFILSCVTGECIADETSFSSSLKMDGNDPVITLIPIKRDIKQMFSSLEITFDGKTSCAKKIVMKEKGGNSTTLVFTNVKTGVPVDKALFQSK